METFNLQVGFGGGGYRRVLDDGGGARLDFEKVVKFRW